MDMFSTTGKVDMFLSTTDINFINSIHVAQSFFYQDKNKICKKDFKVKIAYSTLKSFLIYAH